MNLEEMCKRVSELTKKFPVLHKEEIKELRVLGNNISAECADILYDMSMEEKFNEKNR